MSNNEETNVLTDLAGTQRLPKNLKITEDIPDESETMTEMSEEIFAYIKLHNNFNKMLHNQSQCEQIYDQVIRIIDKYDFLIKDSYKQLWRIFLFSKSFENDNQSIVTLIQTVKTRINHNGIIKNIDNEIRSPIKLKSLIKQILNIQDEYVNIFKIDIDSLTSVKYEQQKNIDISDHEYSQNLENFLKVNNFKIREEEFFKREIKDIQDGKVDNKEDNILKRINFKDTEDNIISVFFNNVKMIKNHRFRNQYYNNFLKILIDNINMITEIIRKKDVENSDKIKKGRYVDVKSTATFKNKCSVLIKCQYHVLLLIYLYLKNNETVKSIDLKVLQYFKEHDVDWFTYQIKEFTHNLYPHWYFKTNGFTLDGIQKTCLQNVELMMSILLSAPTSWGKTLLATYAIRKNNKVIYVIPTGPTGLQLAGVIITSLMESEQLIGEVKKNVRLEIGTYSYKRFSKKDDIIIGTPSEIVRLIKNAEIKEDTDYIILDEFHNISYPNGELYEYILLWGSYNKIPVMCLSATIPNFEEVNEWLSTIFDNNVYSVNEKTRFCNQKRLIIKNGNLIPINPLEHMEVTTLKSNTFTHIGLYPMEVFNLYQKLPDFPRVNETLQKFVSLKDVHNLECDIFTYLKELDDDKLENIISNNPIDEDSLTMFELYTLLKRYSAGIKPMLIFKMDSEKCLRTFITLTDLIKDYNDLVYDNFNDDQPILKAHNDKIEELLSKAKTSKETTSKDDKKERESRMIENVLVNETIPALEKFYDSYSIPTERKLLNMQKYVDDFNKKYSAKLTCESIYELRQIHVKNELAKCIGGSMGLRNEYLLHPEAKLNTTDVSPENTRKVRNHINREIERERKINSNTQQVHKFSDERITRMCKINPGESIDYDHPFMIGHEYGLLCYSDLMAPAFQRVTQYYINKSPSIILVDKTFAVGVNYLIKSVMLLGGLKGEPLEDIDNTLAFQAIGRAGRRGLDHEGIVIYSGVNISDVLVQRYRRVVPNDKKLMESLLTNESKDFKKYVLTGEKPVKKDVKIVETIKEEIKKIIIKKDNLEFTDNTDISVKDIEIKKEEEYMSWEDYADAM
jgi:hypothetical protein